MSSLSRALKYGYQINFKNSFHWRKQYLYGHTNRFALSDWIQVMGFMGYQPWRVTKTAEFYNCIFCILEIIRYKIHVYKFTAIMSLSRNLLYSVKWHNAIFHDTRGMILRRPWKMKGDSLPRDCHIKCNKGVVSFGHPWRASGWNWHEYLINNSPLIRKE